MAEQVGSDRRKFIRKGEEHRRETLIAAALDLIAEGGPAAATVRAIAERAGVTPGLIRHYFTSKDDLTRAAYTQMMDHMTDQSTMVLDALPDDPYARLAGFVAASLRAPVVDPKTMGLWAGFLHQMRRDPQMRAAHEASYLRYRDRLQSLIVALPSAAKPQVARQLAIACNGVIDGLWLEGCALPDAFAPDELAVIGLKSVGAILGFDLARHLPALEG